MNDKMSKHTHGPWRMDKELNLNYETTIAVVSDDKDDGVVVIAEAWKTDDDILPNVKRDKEAVANARLIAAAPDLLESCRELVAMIRESIKGDSAPRILTRDVAKLVRANDVIMEACGEGEERAHE